MILKFLEIQNSKYQKIGLVIHQNVKAMPRFRKMIHKINVAKPLAKV